MGQPSPELKQLWIRVLKRVHPDLAVDEQDRVRCEQLTQMANEAYQAGNVEALKDVLRPSQLPHAGASKTRKRSRQPQQTPPPAEPRVQRGSIASNMTAKRSFKSWFRMPDIPATAFSLKQMIAAVAVVILIYRGLSFYSVTRSLHAVTTRPTRQVDSIEAPIQAHMEVPDAGIWQPRPAASRGNVTDNPISQDLNVSRVADTTVGAPGEGSPIEASLSTTSAQSYPLQDPPQATLATDPTVADSVEPSDLYIKQMRERLYQSFSNYERVDASVPPGNSSETWFDVNRDGSLSNVRVGKPSGWKSLDYACVRAVQRTETVGALPEDYKLRTMPATFSCTYTGSNPLQTSKSVDSAIDRPDLYVGSIRNTAHE
jgi:TonB family protein